MLKCRSLQKQTTLNATVNEEPLIMTSVTLYKMAHFFYNNFYIYAL